MPLLRSPRRAGCRCISASSVCAPPVLMASCLRSWLMWSTGKSLTVLRMSTCATLMPSMLRRFLPTAMQGCGMSAWAIHCSASCLVLPTTMIALVTLTPLVLCSRGTRNPRCITCSGGCSLTGLRLVVCLHGVCAVQVYLISFTELICVYGVAVD